MAASSWDQTPISFFFLLRLLSLFYSTPFHFSLFSLCSVSIYASQSSPSFSSTIVYMYIYKSAHNWCQGKSKEQWGREAIRGIKRGAASQASFTGQWSKSNWVLFCSRTHVYTHTHSVTVVEAHSWQEGLWDGAGLGMFRAGPVGDIFMTLNSPEQTNFKMSLWLVSITII